jgi:choline dehydrogenase
MAALETGLGTSNQFMQGSFGRVQVWITLIFVPFHPSRSLYDGKVVPKNLSSMLGRYDRRHLRGGLRCLRTPMTIRIIEFNYMSDPQDWVDFRKCIPAHPRDFAQSAFEPFRGLRNFAPGDAK